MDRGRRAEETLAEGAANTLFTEEEGRAAKSELLQAACCVLSKLQVCKDINALSPLGRQAGLGLPANISLSHFSQCAMLISYVKRLDTMS